MFAAQERTIIVSFWWDRSVSSAARTAGATAVRKAVSASLMFFFLAWIESQAQQRAISDQWQIISLSQWTRALETKLSQRFMAKTDKQMVLFPRSIPARDCCSTTNRTKTSQLTSLGFGSRRKVFDRAPHLSKWQKLVVVINYKYRTSEIYSYRHYQPFSIHIQPLFLDMRYLRQPENRTNSRISVLLFIICLKSHHY